MPQMLKDVLQISDSLDLVKKLVYRKSDTTYNVTLTEQSTEITDQVEKMVSSEVRQYDQYRRR